ncbi:A kinase (PRKA) anchor protein 1b [Poeciliopsis prolifica]|uniref:A kinase (PRKA) anchor protein 1b n=1 Tax=Poeciliopsis prolifica TaxID=188132 RepID=UPI0024131E22|nr:A kinase (PRKA) anchor protein 1b [Poeciliopsis prolifica]
MPVRFRSVVSYTMPGVLVLIGWWWYTSRKKERPVGQKSPEVSSTSVSFKDSHQDCNNGLLYEEESPAFTNHSKENSENEIISQTPPQDPEAISLLEQTCNDVRFCGRTIHEEADRPSNIITPTFRDSDLVEESMKPLKGPKYDTTPDFFGELEKCPATDLDLLPEDSVEEVALLSNESKDPRFSPMAINLSDAERPEPEGEVATHHSAVISQEEAVCLFTSAETHRMASSDGDSLENAISAQDLHKCILTSTPTILSSEVQGTSTSSDISVDVHSKENPQEMSDLEILAAGLITEVLSAATQEVLGTSSCDVAANTKPSNMSVILADDTQSSQLDPMMEDFPADAPSQENHEHTEAAEKEVQAVPKGFSVTPEWGNVEARILKTNSAQNAAWPTLPHQRETLLNRCDDAAVLNEDSACSTYHSEEGNSSEDLQSSMLGNPAGVLKITDSSVNETAPPQSEAGSTTEEAGGNSDAVCGIKKVNGDDLRNGAHGTCELDTDQSGGSDVNSMDSVDSGCTMSICENQGNNSTSSTSELVIWEIEVPKHLVGRLIGKQGRYVSFLKQNSGAKIYISTLPYTQDFQICHIEGLQQQVDKALSFIGKKFKDLDLTNLYAPPLALPSLPITSWLLLPSGVTVEVIVVNIVSAGHIFVQQHTHPTYHALRSLDQQMFLCYSQPGTPALPLHSEVGVICAAPAVDGAWWRAQVISFYKETDEVEIRYVDYGGYDKVKIDSLRQIRSDFVTLPFQGTEVLLDNVAPLPGEDCFSTDATTTLEEMTRGVALLLQVSHYDNNTGLQFVHLWNLVGEEVISVNRTLAERGLTVWVDGF